MIQDVRLNWFIAIVLLTLPAAAARAATISIDTVPMGNLGNGADTRYDTTGYGAVSYSYNIGKYEVTAGQYTVFLNAVAATDTYELYNGNMWSSSYGCKIQRTGSSGSYSYSVESEWANRPVNFVSFWDAARFANWLHNGQGSVDTESGAYINIGDQLTFARQPDALYFIPTKDEWYKAAYHKNDGVTGNYFGYPTSSDSAPSNDLVEQTDPGNNATFYDGGYTDSNHYRTEVGAHEKSESPYGTFDQGGNVRDWNETITYGPYRGLRGGSFSYLDNGLHASIRCDGYPTGSANAREEICGSPCHDYALA